MTERASLIVTNARVLTMDPDRPRAEGVALAGERVLAVGAADDIAVLAGPGCEVIDARGATVLPGFVESHLHVFMGGAELDHLQLAGVTGRAALSEAIQAWAQARPDKQVILAQGAEYDMLGAPVSRADLDAILPERPFAMLASDHHTAWANTAALRAAGLLHGATLPPGNEVVMGEDGLATGELREFDAFEPIRTLAGEERVNLGISTGLEPDLPPTPAERARDCEILARGLEHCARHGITSMVNMDGNRYTLELLAELHDEGRLNARVRVPFHYRAFRQLSDLEEASALARDYRDDWLNSGFVKLFMDGVIDSGTAFMLDGYGDRPDHHGAALFDAEEFAAIATEIDRRGLQIAVHAIGDGAVRRTLDGFAAARAANGARDARHRIEHIELIHPDDVARLGALGVIASLQPGHVPGTPGVGTEPTLTKIGAQRWRDAYPCASLRDAGARLAFASDWPVVDVSPLSGIQAALVRRPYSPDCRDERVGLLEALAAYTIGGAYAEHSEDRKGMLRPGHLADLVVLSDDIEAAAPERIGAMHAAVTICGGRVSWRAA